MKTIAISILLILLVLNLLHAQNNANQKSTIKSAVVIKMTPIPFFFETMVGGNFELDQQSLSFIPHPCSEEDKKVSSMFPCGNHLLKNVSINFDDISRIKRRSYLFIVPNRLFIKKLNGEVYLFTTYKRKAIIEAYNKYKSEHTSVGLK